MKKSEPKIILNMALENAELEEKIKIAMDEYVELLVVKNLDETIIKYVNKRIDKLINGKSWESDSKIAGVSLQEFVKAKTEKTLEEAIGKHAKEILARKLASLI